MFSRKLVFTLACLINLLRLTGAFGVAFENPTGGIVLTGQQGALFDQDLTKLLSDPGTSPYTFISTDLPSWLKINGYRLTGTPAIYGNFTIHVTVKDSTPEGEDFNHPMTISIAHPPPTWTQNPIVLPDANDAAAYTASIGSYAKAGIATDTLTITKGTNAPAWLSIAANGTITANPAPGTAGNYSFTVIVTDETGASASTTVQLTVDHVPPKWIVNPITFTVPEDQSFSGSIAQLATAASSSETLTFALVSGPSWLTIASNGTMTGTPVLANEGANNFIVRVTDNFGGVATPDATLTITVTHTAPSWTQNPIVLSDANDAATYTANIASYAKGGDPKDTLTITAGTNAPAWLSISASGDHHRKSGPRHGGKLQLYGYCNRPNRSQCQYDGATQGGSRTAQVARKSHHIHRSGRPTPLSQYRC